MQRWACSAPFALLITAVTALFVPNDRAELKAAVNAWTRGDRSGDHISYWDTSKVTNMYRVFKGKSSFNDDISGWNTSRVTDMRSMFDGATAFNQPIGDWDTSEVTSM